MISPHSLISEWLGINLYHLIAGLAGGIVNSIRQGNGFVKSFPGTVAGAFVAGWLTPIAVRYIPGRVDPTVEHAVAFVLGLTALVVVEGVFGIADRWRAKPELPPTKP